MPSLLPPAASPAPIWAALSAVDVGVAGLLIALAAVASGHAIIYKREPRSASLWFVIIWILPAAGTLLYVLLGVNRVRRRASVLRRSMIRHRTHAPTPADAADISRCSAEHLVPLMRLVGHVVPRPILAGNSVEVLVNGREAFPAMLAAIDGARTSLGLSSYIFDGDGVGAQFVEALARAHQRGVAVRVLIDDFDARFSKKTAVAPLREAGVAVGVFNPPFVPARINGVHLRNHRKILVIDGDTGFTGGLNIDQRYWHPARPEAAFRDLHFRLRGPVVAHLAEVFADDWQFTTGEALRGHKWFPPLAACGRTLARGIEAGPDENFERLRWAIVGGINAAQHTVRIVTPYFIPDSALIAALSAAALRGVEVDIFLPRHSDLAHVQWASRGQLWQILEWGCRVWNVSGPFDHSKLLVVDSAWTLLGSANWDARSLRLNFEFNVECYCCELGARLEQEIAARRAHAHAITPAQLKARPLLVKLRDGAARMFAPYL
ncbi:MAG: cardiolipin synthase [Verrucomicrobia bacterium]|nr:cardiolipin synthase [Verrucomicrobiota bacterium]